MANNKMYIGICDKIKYPSSDQAYSPTEKFPEYKFKEIDCTTRNEVYDIIREGFHKLGYDSNNYDKSTWNPLGDIINKGNTVLIKPNWVMHRNKNKKFTENLDCLVTHPSLVRVIIDYVLIALNGTGKIIIADAPMQGCDLQKMLKKHGYSKLFEYYKNKNIEINVKDLRQVQAVTNSNVIVETVKINNSNHAINVKLNEKSFHLVTKKMYKVSDYLADITNKYHNKNLHNYSINRDVLESDVIINMPKPKCHRLAGLTSAQKNFVGIVFDKASLPHRAIGSKKEGGDEYLDNSKIKSYISKLEERKLEFARKKRIVLAYVIQLNIAIFYYIIKYIFKDRVLLGSWYGNDTIWRTVADLNLIIKYSDKNGIIKDTLQRKILNIADMIIAGEGNGPIRPKPKKLGIVLISEDSSFMDTVSAKIMGFDINKIPGLKRTLNDCRLSFSGEKIMLSNINMFNNIKFENMKFDARWKFEPHDNWKGFIEE